MEKDICPLQSLDCVGLADKTQGCEIVTWQSFFTLKSVITTTYFSTSIHPWVAPWASPVIQVWLNMNGLSWLKIYPIDILCFQFFCTIYDIYFSIPTITINVVCSLLFAVGISLEFKVENFCLNNLFGPWTLNLDCQVYKCIIV